MKAKRKCWGIVWAAVATVTSRSPIAGGEPVRMTKLYEPFVEWSAENPSYAGNPFDLAAAATFTHRESGVSLSTGLFYDGGDTWKWRFTGTRLGEWLFRTTSDDPELDGITGTVQVEANDDPNAYGFAAAQGTKWIRPKASDGRIHAFVPQLAMTGNNLHQYTDAYIEGQIETFLVEHGFNGLHVPHVAGKWFDITGDEDVERSNENPDRRAFAALEKLITRSHAVGGHVHIWAWGDAARGWTNRSLSGGINGEEDRRLQRYIAARLGPLPGWSMGYGFDLDEWAGASSRPERYVEPWRSFLHGEPGWPHFFGGRPEGPNRGTDHSRDAPWNVNLDYAGYEHHEPTYEVYVAALEAGVRGEKLGKPVMSEDRFRIRDGGAGKDYTMAQVRRGLWLSTMAGGVANIWGDLEPSSAAGHGSRPFDNSTWVKTYAVFWQDRHHDRFRTDSARANELTGGPQEKQYALVSDDAKLLVIYATDTVEVDLRLAALAKRSGWPRTPLSVLGVDTLEPYTEIDLGTVDPADRELDLSEHGKSDWALVLTPADGGAEQSFRRGSVNGDRSIDISDAVMILLFLFVGAEIGCPDAADLDDDGKVLLEDAVRLLRHFFSGAPAPAEPYESCGRDATEDKLGCAGDPGCE